MSLPESLQSEGGPAFPCSNDGDKVYNWLHTGMSLRDWFAGMAMHGLATNSGAFTEAGAKSIAVAAYAIAEEMLKERERG